MITLITGVPGAGKTLYCVSNILPEIIGTKVPGADGAPDTPRTLYTNINGLLLDHELIDAGPEGLGGWHKWCKPGDYIVFDEVQQCWKQRPNGSKVPEEIGALETHRHMGVDMVFLTQHPMLLDSNVRALVGRHLHVRRMGGMGAAIVYEWDHCSRTLTYSNSITRKPWRYNKKAFKDYKSSELHTKQKKSLPMLLWFVFVVLAAVVYFMPATYQRMLGKKTDTPEKDKPETSTPAGATAKPPGASKPKNTGAPARATPDTDNFSVTRVQIDDLMLSGYMANGNIRHALFAWYPEGQYRYTFNLVELTAAGLHFEIRGGCHVVVFDQEGRERNLFCTPRPPVVMAYNDATASPSEGIRPISPKPLPP